jgi:UDP-4-amino-4,6-dideoxy-N-acetyl-beta-L-altrosamine transaminase
MTDTDLTAPGTRTLPYGRQTIEDDDIAAVAEVLARDLLTTGPAVEAFEGELARITGARHAVACANGTAALHLASLALGLGSDDAVIVPSVTFVATANGARLAGAEVFFADVDPDTGLMGPAELEAAMIRAMDEGVRPRAVYPVALTGQRADPIAIREVADHHRLKVVTDACHALGTRFNHDGATVRAGDCHHAVMEVFSFHPVKTIAMGEGGAITTNDQSVADRLRLFRGHGIRRDSGAFRNHSDAHGPDGGVNPWYYEMQALGLNYRVSDINCALGLSQLKKLDRFAARRAALAARYDALIGELAPAVRPIGRVPGCAPAWHLYAVLIDFDVAGVDRATVMNRLKDKGIGTQVHYYPVHRQPYYVDRYGKQSLPGADAYYARTLSLPLYPAMKDDDVDYVIGALAEVLRR